MEAKEAYQQLLDEKEGRAGRGPAGGAGSARGGRAPGSGASGWGGYQSGSSTSSGYGRASSYQGQQRWQPPEPDYSFGERGWVGVVLDAAVCSCHAFLRHQPSR